MRKIKIRLPATITDFSPALRSLGLAIGLYLQVDFIPRYDTQLILETEGEGAYDFPSDLQHPVLLGMMHVFQLCEQAPMGFTVRISNNIPLNSGLGAEASFFVAGIVGANNLIGVPFRRDELVQIIAESSVVPSAAVASMLGGLTTYFTDDDGTYFRQLPIEPFKLVIAIPQLDDYRIPQLDATLPQEHVIKNIQKIPVLLDAFQAGDWDLLARVLDDQLLAPVVQSQLIGYETIANFAKQCGAFAVTTSGGGPAMIFFAKDYHERLAELLEIEYSKLGVAVRTLVVPVDTQGIVISMMQMSA